LSNCSLFFKHLRIILIIFSAQLFQKLSPELFELSEELTRILLISLISSSVEALKSGLNVWLSFRLVGFSTIILNHLLTNDSFVLALISPDGSVTMIEQLSSVKILGIINPVVFHHQVRAIRLKCSKLCFCDSRFLSPSSNNPSFFLFKNFFISLFDRNSASLFNFSLLYQNSKKPII
jgi:hypothetical protein